MRPSDRAGLQTILLAAVLVGAGCGGPVDDGRDELPERRRALRAELRERLGDTYDEPVPAGTPEDIRRGAATYARLCAGCHGAGGRGDGEVSGQLFVPPGDLTDPERAATLSDRARLEIIRSGIDGTPMVGWTQVLDGDQIVDVFQYTRTLVGAE